MAKQNQSAIWSNTDTGLLKLIACISMVVDHAGKVFFSGTRFYMPMRAIGRLAFPLFSYSMAVGCRYTRNIGLYALRLLALAILVQPLNAEAMGHVAFGAFNWKANFLRVDLIFRHYYSGDLNILFSLFLGVVLIWTIRDRRFFLTAIFSVLCFLMQDRLDYGAKGILLMVMYYCLMDYPLSSVIWTGILMAHWGMPYLLSRGSMEYVVQLYAMLAMPLIYVPLHSRLRLNKYFFYAFYPAHLLVIYLIQYWGR